MVDIRISKFAEILSWIEPRPDGCTLAVPNFHIKAWSVRTMKDDVRTVTLMHAISIYETWAFGPWRLKSGQLNVECTTFLMKDSVRTGTHIILTVVAVFPYLCFGKKSHSWSNTERRPDVLLRGPDGCSLERFEASWHRGRSGRKVIVVQMDYDWTVERLDRCKVSNFFDLEFVQNLLEA